MKIIDLLICMNYMNMINMNILYRFLTKSMEYIIQKFNI